MPIASKLTISIIAVFVMSVLANYAVLQATIKPQFDDIEIAAAKLNHQRVLDAMEGLQAKLRNSAQDWAFWDDTHDFAKGKDVQDFLKVNLEAPVVALDGLGIELLMFSDTSGQLLWGEAIDLSTKERMPSLVTDIVAADYKHPMLTGPGEAKASSGLIATSKGLVLVAAAPIIRSDRSGTPAGTLWLGSRLDTAALQDVTGVKFRFEGADLLSPSTPSSVQLRTLDAAVETSSLITDLFERPLVVLTAQTPRDVSMAGGAAIRWAIWLSIAAGAVVSLVLWMLVNRVVVAPVIKLKEHFSTASTSGPLQQTQLIHCDDEIGQLANSFNGMAAQVNQLRETLLADCSYLGGISEWAAGTLHNVRNGLSPINVAAWKTKSLFESPWLTSFKTALEQLQSSAITAERREKLAAYVLSRASELLDYAEQAKLASQEVMSASKSVEDMVSGYEQFCRKGVKHEPIDLLPFIRDIAKTTVASRAMDVQLILPDTSITINSNKTILYQILSNLFVNALDAMESSSRQKSIWVDWDEADGERGGLRLSISDNGEGIAPSILESIFDRGFSTRQHKIGGLGLHWCRCAIKELGGTLEAASDGPGTGAKLVLHLPASATPAFALKAAA